MSLTMLRERQKFFIWIIAVIIVPLFIVSMAWDPTSQQQADNSDPAMLQVGEETILSSEVYRFLDRIRSQFPYFPFEMNEETLHMLGMWMLQLQEAEKAGLRITEAEVGEEIRNNFGPQFTEAKSGTFDKEAYRNHIKNQFRMEVPVFHQAVREGLLLQRFNEIIGSRTVASPLEGYHFWAAKKATLNYDLLEVKTVDYLEKAREELKDRFKEEVALYLKANAQDRSLFQSGLFRIEYILSPFEKMPISPVTEEAITAYFHGNKAKYEGKELEAVKEEILKTLTHEQKQISAQSIISDVDSILTGLAGSEKTVTVKEVMAESELRRKSELGLLITGDSGESPSNINDLMKLPAFANAEGFRYALETLDRETDTAARDGTISKLTMNFNLRNASIRENFSSDQGVFKFRIIDYKPGTIRDPSQDSAFAEDVFKRVIENKAEALAQAALRQLVKRVAEGDTKDITLLTKEEPLSTAPRELTSRVLEIGEATEPVMDTATNSCKIYILRGYSIPSYATFSQEPDEIKKSETLSALNLIRRGSQGMGGDRSAMWRRLNSDRIKVLINLNDNEEQK